jgi:hypothetical protein
VLSLPFALLKITLVAVLTFCLLNVSIDDQPLFYHLRKFIFAKSIDDQMTQAVEDMKKRAGEALSNSLKTANETKQPKTSIGKESGKKKESDPIKDLIKKKSP